MTISTTTRKAGPYVGNGVQTVFPFTFKIFAVTDVLAQRAVAATTAETLLVLGVDYTVAMNADQDASPGGEITLTTPPTAAQTVTIRSQIPQLQSVILANGGGFFPAVFNGVFDKLVAIIQQVSERVDRTLRIKATTQSVVDLEVPITALGYLRWNATGTALDAVTSLIGMVAGQIAFPAVQNPSADTNTLDDYREGTTSLTITAVTTPPAGVAYTTNAFSYVKVGRLVTLHGQMTLSSKGAGGVGPVRITGLPFMTGGHASIAVGFADQLTLPANGRLGGTVAQGDTVVALQKLTLGSGANLDWSEINGTMSLFFSITYVSSQ